MQKKNPALVSKFFSEMCTMSMADALDITAADGLIKFATLVRSLQKENTELKTSQSTAKKERPGFF